MATLGAAAALIVVPALSVLYREFFWATGARASALVVGSMAVGAAAVWLVTGFVVPGVGGSALYAPTFTLAIMAALLSGLPSRRVTRAALPALLYSLAWTGLVFVPVALAVFYPQTFGLAPLSVPLDLGGVLAVHLAAGCAAFVAVRSRRGRPPSLLAARPTGATLLAAGLALWLGWMLLLVGLELHFSDATPRIVATVVIAPSLALVGWLAVQRIITATTTAHGAIAGLICGLVAVTPGSAYLDPVGAGVVGAVAGVAGGVLVLRRVSRAGEAAWFLVGAHWVAGVVGLIALGIISSGRGFVFTGQVAILQTHFIAILLVSAWACTVSLLLWLALWLFARLVGTKPAEATEPPSRQAR